MHTESANATLTPNVFISYSWVNEEHRNIVKSWADRLIDDGVQVIIDMYDLREGDDKYAFMERMVTDEAVTHVLAVCDRSYKEKANARKAGVGVESQIISKSLYESVQQGKIVPLVFSYTDGEPDVPLFFQSRIYIDFSSPEKVNENWEQLVRHLYGKPLHRKPKLGRPPVYIEVDEGVPQGYLRTQFESLKQAIFNKGELVGMYRSRFLKSCLEYGEEVRRRQTELSGGDRIKADFEQMKVARNVIVDWLQLESRVTNNSHFEDELLRFLENLKDLKFQPSQEENRLLRSGLEAQSIFICEVFLYTVAVLLEAKRFSLLRRIFTFKFMQLSDHDVTYNGFKIFYCHAPILSEALRQESNRKVSGSAAAINQASDREDLKFEALLQADLLIFLVALIKEDGWWYPATVFYASYDTKSRFFAEAARHDDFQNLLLITGCKDVEDLRQKVSEGRKRAKVDEWREFMFINDLDGMLNLANLDSVN